MQLARVDELQVLSERLYGETASLPKEQRIKKLCDELLELLILAYVFGANRVDEELMPDVQTMLEAIYKPVAGETFEQRIAKRVEEDSLSLENLTRIIETDWHRVEETGAYDTAVLKANRTGKQAYKIWRTMLDERVREQHWWIEGQEVPIDEKFTTPDGAQAMFPGEFGIADQDCNCRCEVEYTFR